MTQAFPLQWPRGRKRSKDRSASAFKVSPSRALDELYQELERFAAENVVVSTNIPTRLDGTPYRDGLTQAFEDPGVAVYFTKGKHAICMPCDTYRSPWENIRAIGLSVEAFRTMERHGAHQILDQAFEGFMALPPPGAGAEPAARDWWEVLGVKPNATTPEIRAAYKARARAAGGATTELNAARDAGLAAQP